MKQLTKKNILIEKFKEQINNNSEPKPFTKNDYNIYANIIGVFKHKLGKEPTVEELFVCYTKIIANELSLVKLNNLLEKEPKNYRLFLFPEIEQKLLSDDLVDIITPPTEDENNQNNQNNQNNENDDNTSTDAIINEHIEKSTRVLDENNKVQYIINRPTIYNIGTNYKKGIDSLSTDTNTSTQQIIEAVRNTMENENNEDNEDNENMDNEDESLLTVQDVESKTYRNRCQTQEELEDQNKLAIKRGERNMNELKYSCQRGNTLDEVATDYDDMLLRDNQRWKIPQRYPSLCKRDSKKKCKVNPIEVQSTLLGTLIDNAKDTKIGSIMPQFSYKEKNNNDETKIIKN
jgi:hypothetical protein